MSVKVSVVIPVYNAGASIEPCIAAILGQSMPDEDYEAIFVDDGSTDGSGARLDELAAEHENVRVVHIPNSGWPGKPRNVGIDAAAGEYVQFVDQDDMLAREALDRLYGEGVRTRADIVIGKVASNFRPVPHILFQENRERCTIHNAPLINSLTPHKMFNKAFLDEHVIRYPEGKRRLEDQLFMVRAYFPAKAVTVVSDYVCYFYKRRDDLQNAGSQKFAPRDYFANLREVLDVVEQNTEPGEFRDALLRRFLRTGLLQKLSEPKILRRKPAYQRELHEQVHKLVFEYFPETVDATLPPVLRVRSALLREGDLDGLLALARRCARVKATAAARTLGWEAPATLRASVEASLVDDDGSPVLVARDGDRYELDLGEVGRAGEPGARQAGSDLADATATVRIRDRKTATEWTVPSQLRMRLEPVAARADRYRVVFTGEAGLGATVPLDDERPLDRGVWDVRVSLNVMGLTRNARLHVEPRATRQGDGLLPAVLGPCGTTLVPFLAGARGALRLDVDGSTKKLGKSIEGPLVARPAGGAMEVPLPVVTDGRTPELSVQALVRPRAGAPGKHVPARLVPRDGRAVVEVTGRGRPTDAAARQLVGVRVDGQDIAVHARPPAVHRRLWYAARGLPRRPVVRSAVRGVLRRLPEPARPWLRRLGQRATHRR